MQAGAAPYSGDAGAWQQYHQQGGEQQQDEVKTLWIGDLLYWMDENYLWSCFGPSGEVRERHERNSRVGKQCGGAHRHIDSSASSVAAYGRSHVCIINAHLDARHL